MAARISTASREDVVTISDSGSDSDFIENSVSDNDSYTQFKKKHFTAQTITHVPESEEDSDETNTTDQSRVSTSYTRKTSSSGNEKDESPEIHRGFKSHKRLAIESDSESARSDDDLAMSAATRMSIHGVRPADMDSDESVLTESEDEVPLIMVKEKQDVDAVLTDVSRNTRNDSLERSTRKTSSSANEENESPEIHRGFKSHKRLAIESDSESARSDDDLAMSAATRMSIHGVRPADMDSDESALTESEDEVPLIMLKEKQDVDADLRDVSRNTKNDSLERSTRKTSSSANEKGESPEMHRGFKNHNRLAVESEYESARSDDDFAMSAATRTSIHGVRPADMDSDESVLTESEGEVPLIMVKEKQDVDADLIDVSWNTRNDSLERSSQDLTTNNDNSVCIINKNVSEIILSSDESDDGAKQSKSRKSNVGMPTIKKFLVPSSYPNSGIVYVQKPVKINEMNKLETLREDLQKLRYLIENLDVSTLPDNGTKLSMRLSKLEEDVKEQGERVSRMVVEPDNPSASDIDKDGFGVKKEGYSWEELQAASNKVQPKMFGKHAMSTHVMERTRIMDRLRDLHESLASRPGESLHHPQPRMLTAKLMPHQTHALSWLIWRETQRPAGGILADDMGLGKTLTMISLIANSKQDQGGTIKDDDDQWSSKENSKLIQGGTLIVCPASLVGQWAGEVVQRCKKHSLSVELHHGAQRETKPYKLARHDMVITTYNLISRDLPKKGALMRVNWSRIILDEAHIVRNHKSLTAQAVFELRGRTRWCLTGTPVQNKDLDIFALMKFLRCTPFDDILMWKKWIDNKSEGGQERLATLMRCLLLRRTKQQLQEKGALASLPERNIHNIEVTLSKEEMNVYQKVLVFSKTLFAQFLHQRAEKEGDMSGGFISSKTPNEAYDKMHKRMVQLQGAKPVKSHEILVLLLRLRQLCCHPGLISGMLDEADDTGAGCRQDAGSVDLLSELAKLSIDEGDGDDKKNKSTDGAEDGTSLNDALRSVLSLSNPVFNLKKSSAKLGAAIECLSKILKNNTDEKAVVVSQWTSVLSIVEQHLKKQGVSCSALTGKVPVSARSDVVTKFNDPKNKTRILLLSLCAGGVGLNLVGGNHLLLLDLHWNPQLEAQAQDRVYRVGQTKTVHIYKFMCVDTVEQSIRKLQEHKLEIADSVLTGAKHTKSSKLSIEDLKILFNMA